MFIYSSCIVQSKSADNKPANRHKDKEIHSWISHLLYRNVQNHALCLKEFEARGRGATAKGGATERYKDGQRGRQREDLGVRRRGKGSTVSAGDSKLPGSVTMSSPWEHRARGLFWTNRQLSRQWWDKCCVWWKHSAMGLIGTKKHPNNQQRVAEREESDGEEWVQHIG